MTELDDVLAEYGSREDGTEPSSWTDMGYARFPRGAPDAWVDESLPSSRLDQVDDTYDVVVIGAGAGGGVAASVLARGGAHVLLVERGESIAQTTRDHARNHRLALFGHNTGPGDGHPRVSVTPDGRERTVDAGSPWFHNNAMTVGGGTRVYGAQAWRFLPDDFRMATRYGVPHGSSLADWPLSYDDVAPYYARVERDLGVGSFDEGREHDVLAGGASALGWATEPTPLLVNTSMCIRCGECIGFSCPVGAKIGTHNTVIPEALAAGATLVTGTLASRIDPAANRVDLVDDRGSRSIRAGHIVVSAGAIESARLLLNSGVGGDHVGRHLQGHPYAGALGLFEEPVIDGLGPGPVIATRDFAHGNDDIVGGGLIGNEFVKLPLIFRLTSLPPGSSATPDEVRSAYRRTVHLMGPAQEIPTADARVTVSSSVRDRFGVPVARLSGSHHRATTPALDLLAAKAEEWLIASGARRTWPMHGQRGGLSAGQHQAGTCRMGDDPATSVVDPDGRVHGHPNLWVMDGSVHVTNGGANPVLTILALSLRAAERLQAAG